MRRVALAVCLLGAVGCGGVAPLTECDAVTHGCPGGGWCVQVPDYGGPQCWRACSWRPTGEHECGDGTCVHVSTGLTDPAGACIPRGEWSCFAVGSEGAPYWSCH